MKSELRKGPLASLKEEAVKMLESGGFKVDYVEIANQNSLHLVDNWDGTQPLVTLVAAYMGDVRLIDNMIMTHNNL